MNQFEIIRNHSRKYACMHIFYGCVISLLCFLPALLLLFPGFFARYDWNNNAIKTECTIISQTVEDVNCYDTSEHYKKCYDGFITVSFNDTNNIYYKMFCVYKKKKYNDIVNLFNEMYINGTKIDCYYNPKNPIDVMINKKSVGIFLAFFIVFSVIGLFLIGIYIYIFCS